MGGFKKFPLPFREGARGRASFFNSPTLTLPRIGGGDKNPGKDIMNKQLKERSRDLRKNLTDAEQKLWQKLRNKQINAHKFRRQFVLGNYIVDFICLEKRLIIEVDGGQHMENVDYDLQRDEWLKSQNFKVLRFWNNQVLNEIDSVLEVIVKDLE